MMPSAAQADHRLADARLDRAERLLQALGDLRVRQSFVVGKRQRGALVVGQAGHRLADQLAALDQLGRLLRSAHLAHLGRILGGHPFMRRARPHPVDRPAAGDGEQPVLQGALCAIEAVRVLPELPERVDADLLGRAAVAGDAQGEGVDRPAEAVVELRQRPLVAGPQGSHQLIGVEHVSVCRS